MNKNLIIALVIVGLILLALLAFNQMYRPGTSPDGVSPPWRMGPGMGPGMMYGPGYNYSGFGPMMGYGDMMALYYPDARPISSDEARRRMESFAQQYGSNIEIEDFMAFSANYYAVLRDPGSNQTVAEVLVDRYSGSAYPEPGPNRMWNTMFGAGREGSGGPTYGQGAARGLAEDFLAGYLPGARVMESEALPGYYTFDFGREEIEGMLSVNAYSGQIWVHTWHGTYIEDVNGTA